MTNIHRTELENLSQKAQQLEQKHNTDEDICNFINGFNQDIPKGILHTYCYQFAIILQHLYGGEIYYNPIWSHTVVKVRNHYFDINGLHRISTMPDFVDIVTHKANDPSQYYRMVRDCVYKLT